MAFVAGEAAPPAGRACTWASAAAGDTPPRQIQEDQEVYQGARVRVEIVKRYRRQGQQLLGMAKQRFALSHEQFEKRDIPQIRKGSRGFLN